MSKSAREDRPWKYIGNFKISPPITRQGIQKQIVRDCRCYGCEANRRWLKQMNETKERQE